MLCQICRSLFQPHRLGPFGDSCTVLFLGDQPVEGVLHQDSAESVDDSSQHGCQICTRLKDIRLSLGTSQTLSTSCLCIPLYDVFYTDDGEEPREHVGASHLQYRLYFWWKGLQIPSVWLRTSFGSRYNAGNGSHVTYRLLETESKS